LIIRREVLFANGIRPRRELSDSRSPAKFRPVAYISAEISFRKAYFVTKGICDKAGVRRDQIGLITGARAELYFNGSWKSVSFDAIDELSTNGTDIIFIEKEGIPDELKEFADKCGIAMLKVVV
jgi:hypothetical protein